MLLEASMSDQITQAVGKLLDSSVDIGLRLLGAIAIYLIGKYIIKWLNKLFEKLMIRRKLDPTVTSFLKSLINILLYLVLALSIIGQLGIKLTGIAALIASAGMAVGMALSGNLSNFAGGLLILVFRPFKVGDYIESSAGASGTVKEIQIFHTILVTPDNKTIYAPNGNLSNGVITNYSMKDLRRVEWDIAVEYGTDFNKVEQVVKNIIAQNPMIVQTPEPSILIGELADSSVNIKIRVWVKTDDYWAVNFQMNKDIYETFNKEGIEFPFPQLTVHQG
ncbi:MAG: mechanosensitive ion channel [Phocaeicola sp.]|nr:mechanosensitive ion channel [Phocaeicola sp.]